MTIGRGRVELQNLLHMQRKREGTLRVNEKHEVRGNEKHGVSPAIYGALRVPIDTSSCIKNAVIFGCFLAGATRRHPRHWCVWTEIADGTASSSHAFVERETGGHGGSG
jgi:hypothetical protein